MPASTARPATWDSSRTSATATLRERTPATKSDTPQAPLAATASRIPVIAAASPGPGRGARAPGSHGRTGGLLHRTVPLGTRAVVAESADPIGLRPIGGEATQHL